MRLICIDPGTRASGYVELRRREEGPPEVLLSCGELANGEVVERLAYHAERGIVGGVAIEAVESYGMAVGRDVFETVHWAGRFHQAALPLPVHRVGRKEIKLHLCLSLRAKDSSIRQALLDLYGGEGAVGRKANPGPLYGVKKHAWAALALGVTWLDTAPPE